MSIFSWLRSRRSTGEKTVDEETVRDRDAPRSLLRFRYEDPKLAEIERNAAEDVAAIREDEKYFGPDAPAKQDGL
jgi:hypothetical protein